MEEPTTSMCAKSSLLREAIEGAKGILEGAIKGRETT